MVTAAVGNFNWKDWATFAGTTAACYPFGWAVGQFLLAIVCAGSSVYACYAIRISQALVQKYRNSQLSWEL